MSSTLVFYATSSGGTTLDRDDAGGNPFATALIDIAGDPNLRLGDLPRRLRELTAEKSRGHQVTEYVGDARVPDWKLRPLPGARTEQREALVLVVSDYSASGWARSLAGAARDERRISSMLSRCGFSVAQRISPGRGALLEALASFRQRSAGADIAIVYSTGHGVELDGDVHLIPGDFPGDGPWGAQLQAHAISVSRIIDAAGARSQNLVFFAGCRTQVSANGQCGATIVR